MRAAFAMTVLLVGCGPPSDKGTPSESTEPTPVGVCADGGWGPFGGPNGVVHVAADGDDAASGGWADPVASVAVALDRVADGAGTSILVGDGDYTTSASLLAEAHAGVALAGCTGGEGVTLRAVDETVPVITIDGAQGVSISDVATSGGRRAVQAVGGAEVRLERVAVVGSTTSGILVTGTTSMTLVDVEIDGTIADPETGLGYGVSSDGFPSDAGRANISMEGGEIRDSVGVGLIAEATNLTLVGLAVSGTRPVVADGVSLLGRGIQVQGFSTLDASLLRLQGNADAGIFSVATNSLVLGEVEVIGTEGSAVPGGDGVAVTGDGVVAIRGEAAAEYDVSWFTVSVSSSVIDGNARAGVLLEDVTLAFASDNTGINRYGSSLFVYQGETVIAKVTDGTEEAESDLPFNESPLLPDSAP